MIVEARAQSDEIESAPLRVQIAWNGQWSDDTAEMARRLRGSGSPPETGEQLAGEFASTSPPMSAFPMLNARSWEHQRAASGRLRPHLNLRRVPRFYRLCLENPTCVS